jgi:hypothetical protein
MAFSIFLIEIFLKPFYAFEFKQRKIVFENVVQGLLTDLYQQSSRTQKVVNTH